MIVDPSILGKFRCSVWRKYIYKVGILGKKLGKSLLGYQVSYLRFMKEIDIKRGGTKGQNIN